MNECARPIFETAAATHPGTVRRENEDAYLDGAEAGIWAVADGMGGHAAGQFASRVMIEALRAISPQSSATRLLELCATCVAQANTRLLQKAEELGATIGTTLAALLVHGIHFACVWSGDSRIYRIRDGAIALMSRDHTEVQDFVERGIMTERESRMSPRRNVITRAIGVTAEAELELAQGVLAVGDTFLLCSDGLSNPVSDDELRAMVLGRSAEDACHALIGLAIARGGADNITVVVVRYIGDGDVRPDGGTVVEAIRA